RARLDAARDAEIRCRNDWREAQRGISAAQAGLDAAHKNLSELTARSAALAEASQRVDSGLAEAIAEAEEASGVLAELGAEGDAVREAETRQRALANLRESAEQARMRLAGFESASKMR